MQKLRNWITSFIANHIEAVFAAIGAALFGGIIGWWKGFRDGTRRKEKELTRTKEALRKCQAELDVLNSRDKKNTRRIRKLGRIVEKHESRIEELERELGRQ